LKGNSHKMFKLQLYSFLYLVVSLIGSKKQLAHQLKFLTCIINEIIRTKWSNQVSINTGRYKVFFVTVVYFFTKAFFRTPCTMTLNF